MRRTPSHRPGAPSRIPLVSPLRPRALGTALAAGLALLLATPLRAQDAPPPAEPADVQSVDAILTAVYDVISGPAGEARDWDRFLSLFAPGARLIPTGPAQGGGYGFRDWSPQEYAETAGRSLEQSGFFEREIHRTEDRYGPVVQAFSTYESYRTAQDESPFDRGINSFQLFFDGSRWWIQSIFWFSERSGTPIPDEYLPGTE